MTAKDAGKKYPGEPRNVADLAWSYSAAGIAAAEHVHKQLQKSESGKSPAPHYNAMIDYLKTFTGGPYEREMWDLFYRVHRPPAEALPRLEANAATVNFSVDEFIARITLGELTRYVAKRPCLLDYQKAMSAAGTRGKDRARGKRRRLPEPRPLTDKERGAWELVRHEGLSFSKAGKQLNVCPKTVREAVQRAEKKLGPRVVRNVPRPKTKSVATDYKGRALVTEDRRKT